MCSLIDNVPCVISNLTSVDQTRRYQPLAKKSDLPAEKSYRRGYCLLYPLSARRKLRYDLPRHILKLFCSLLVSWEGEKKGEDRPQGWSRCQFAGIHRGHVRPESPERSYAQAHVLDLRNTEAKHRSSRKLVRLFNARLARIDQKFPLPISTGFPSISKLSFESRPVACTLKARCVTRAFKLHLSYLISRSVRKESETRRGRIWSHRCLKLHLKLPSRAPSARN